MWLKKQFQAPIVNLRFLQEGWHCKALYFECRQRGYVLKISPYAHPPEREYWASKTLGTAFKVPFAYGQGYLKPWYWVLQDYCPGTPLPQKHIKNAVPLLLALHHRATPLQRPPAHLWRTHLRGSDFVKAKIRFPERLPPARWRFLISCLYAAVDKIPENLALHWIHGDLKPEHMPWQEGISGWIDWEAARPGDWLYDWSSLAFQYAINSPLQHIRIGLQAALRQQSDPRAFRARWQSNVYHHGLSLIFARAQSNRSITAHLDALERSLALVDVLVS